MPIAKLLIANRGEIAIRIARAAAELGISSVAIYSEDDAASLHRRAGDAATALTGFGPRAYLDAHQVVAAALATGCDAIHPGYGFLAENPDFARLCEAKELIFVGPSPEALELFGDKLKARDLAERLGVPLAQATKAGASVSDIRALMASLPAGEGVMIKAAAGGGGRGMRRVEHAAALEEAYGLCGREAAAAFGDGRLYAERLVRGARHIEVQVVGDGRGVCAVHDRECSIQRRHQKIIEIAPAPGLTAAQREAARSSALRMAAAAGYRGLATFEFLLTPEGDLVFLEANPRLQVEHTVTEAVSGLDLVQIQLRIAGGEDLASIGLGGPLPPPSGYAIQLRVNLETLAADGSVSSSAGGVMSRYEPPSGPGVRVDGYGYGGYATSPAFDSLVAKLVVHSASADFAVAVAKARRAAAEFRIEGVETNLPLLMAILETAEFREGHPSTEFLEAQIGRLATAALALTPMVDAATAAAAPSANVQAPGPVGSVAAGAPLRGTVVALEVAVGDLVAPGQSVAVLEAMKMQHLVAAPVGGRVSRIDVAVGQTTDASEPLVYIAPDDQLQAAMVHQALDLDVIRADVAELRARQALTLDENRPDAVERRRRKDQRTARENIADLFDPGSFSEFGAFAVAAQRRRRGIDDLRLNTPADGIITGVGEVNGTLFAPDRARCVGLAYDFTVLAGTQGHFSHKKTDRVLEFAEHWKLPVIWYTEGGGGRPGDVDGGTSASSLDTTSFTTFARLSGVAPRIAINSGRCFAGNAVFFGCADITIATRYSNIGLGGPAMIEGGGLGVFTPDEIGPSDVLYANGALDLLVEDEAEATAAAKQILGCFQGPVTEWSCADQRALRFAVPENRVRAYEVREVIRTLADTGSWIEMRGGYGPGMITGFLRIEGRPLGVIANDPFHLGGAIDSEGAEKGARFLQLCDAFEVPVLSLCDTPGFMVGPHSETTAAIRRGSRLFVTAASLDVPLFVVVLRKGYGLGAQAMAGGDFSAPAMMLAWPTAEFGPMGLEGAVRLGYSKELAAEADSGARQALFDKLVGGMYQRGKAISVAEVVEIDAVIDPSETRHWLLQGLKSCRPDKPQGGWRQKRAFVDVW